MPAIFLAHGAPPLLDDPAWMGELAAWGKALPRPKSILMLSAHWLDAPPIIGATRPIPLIYDFYGFPQRFYELEYPSPGAPKLAARIHELIPEAKSDESRGLDHGTYVPLMPMYPSADIPVLQMSIPSLDPKALFAFGQRLAPLRDEGVLVIGSGFITHNLGALRFGAGGTPKWASDFDSWVGDAITRRDVDSLLDYKAKAPGVRESLPTHEHFVPLLVSAGMASGLGQPGGSASAGPESITYPINGWAFGAFSKRSVQFG